MGCDMGDAEVRLSLPHHHLRGNAAGPKHRDFAGLDDRRIAIFWFRDVVDTDSCRIAEMYRGAVG